LMVLAFDGDSTTTTVIQGSRKMASAHRRKGVLWQEHPKMVKETDDCNLCTTLSLF
jgi:hypothetical protein